MNDKIGFFDWLIEGFKSNKEILSKSIVIPLIYTFGGLILGAFLVLCVLGSYISLLWKLCLIVIVVVLATMLMLYGMYRFVVFLEGDKK